MAAKKPRRRPKLRWWQIACRVAVLLLLAVLGAYAALPWWAPTGYLRRRLAEELARQMGVGVRIETLSLSWSEGVEIGEVTVESSEAFDSAPMLTVKAIRTELSPLELLLHGRVAWLELIEPQLYVRLDANGDVNVAPLARLKPDVAIERLHVRQGLATLTLPGDVPDVTLRVPTFELDTARIRQIAMSAALKQTDDVGEAPVSLSPGAAGAAAAAASASFTFSNVELAQLPLAQALKLPVRKLSGRCDGSAAVTVNRDGRIEAFGLDVRIRRLDVQPQGEVELPVVDEAGFRISAAYDHLSGALRVGSAAVRLPGVDLRGQAKVFAEVFRGHTEAVESIDFTGKVYPARLAVLLTGRELLAGDVAVAGPVDVTVVAARRSGKLAVRLAAEATEATVRRGEQALKPAGRLCRMGLAGDLDHRTSGFTVSDSYLHLAGNRFDGHGALLSLRRFASRLLEPRGRSGGEILLDELARLDWRGQWEIRDLASLLDLLPAPPPVGPWGEVKLSGPLTGRWFIHHGSATRVHAGFVLPAATRLAVGDRFVKPPGAPLHLDFNAVIDPNETALTDLALELGVGEGHFDIDRAKLVFAAPPSAASGQPGRPLEFTGRVTAENVEKLLACVPQVKDLGRYVQGGLNGRFSLRGAQGEHRLRLSAYLKEARLSLGQWLSKPGGQEAECHLDLRRDPSAPPEEQNLFAATWRSPPGEVTVNCAFPDARPGELPRRGAWVLDAAIADANKLAESSPALRRAVGDGALGGGLKLSARGGFRSGVLDANAVCDATGLEYAGSTGAARRAKAAGTGLVVRCDGRVSRQEGRLEGQVRAARVRFAGSRLDLCGRVEAVGDWPAAGEKLWPQPALRSFQLDANAVIVLDKALRGLAPELDRLVRRHGLAGRAGVQAVAAYDGNGLDVRCGVEAGDLAIGDMLAGLPAERVRLSEDLTLAALAPLGKPAGLPARLDAAVRCPADLSRAAIRDLRARAGGLEVQADGSAEVSLGPDGLPADIRKVALHLAASSRRAEALTALVPALKRYEPAGGVFVDAELADAAAGEVTSATIRLDRFRARYRGRDVTLDGTVQVEGFRPPPRPRAADQDAALPSVGRFQTDGLEFHIGENHGWLLADLTALADKPAGTFHVLAEYLDDRDVMAWLDAAPATTQPATQPGTQAGTQPAARPSYKLSAVQVRALRGLAGELLRLGRRHLAAGKLSGRVSIRHLRTYDISVDRTYDVHRLELVASVEEGRVRLEYVGGLNGGLLKQRYAADLNDPAGPVACEAALRDVLAEENIQPQFARFFPGNTVYGTLEKAERTTAPLGDILAAALDPRYPLHPVGTGKTIAIEGLTQGRAAPIFVTKIFPGLNLAKYRYRKMTAFTELRPDGVTYNDMVFDGKTYDLYMEGTTDAENIGRYEIGLILLGAPQSADWNHTYRQGRIPILNFKARIEGGKRHDEEVSYLWPNETLFVIFLKNNIFYRIWLASGKNSR